jgi:hypothetical protein
MAKKDNTQDNTQWEVPELVPRQGGSYIRGPATGELAPNADDHVMAFQIAQSNTDAPAAPTSEVSNNG